MSLVYSAAVITKSVPYKPRDTSIARFRYISMRVSILPKFVYSHEVREKPIVSLSQLRDTHTHVIGEKLSKYGRLFG